MASNNSNDTHNDPNSNRQTSSQNEELNEEHNTTFERSVYTEFFTFSLIKKVFLATNTSLPPSASVERLFSMDGQIMTPRRNGLSDDHFEMLLLLRANRALCR